MRYAVKSKKKIVKAYQLGRNTEMEQKLIAEGAIAVPPEGQYELFSQEAVNGKGELAQSGDYFKLDEIDGMYYPYPNEQEWFEANHTHLQGDEYEQKAKPLAFWKAEDEMCEEIRFLIDTGKLTIQEDDWNHYFNAFLFGTDLSAKKDAAIIFYSIKKDENGMVMDVDFNFVAKEQFESDYEIV